MRSSRLRWSRPRDSIRAGMVDLSGVVEWAIENEGNHREVESRWSPLQAYRELALAAVVMGIEKSPTRLRRSEWMWFELFWVLFNSMTKVGPWTT